MVEHSGNGIQFEYCWIRAKKNSGSVQAAIELMGEERAKDLAAIWWRYGVYHEAGRLLLRPDGTDYDEPCDCGHLCWMRTGDGPESSLMCECSCHR